MVVNDTSSLLLSALIFLPLVGAASLVFMPADNPSAARLLAGFVSYLSLILSFFVVYFFDATVGGFQLAELKAWLPAAGINYIVGVDGISLWLLVLTCLLSFLVILASSSIRKHVRAYLACLLVLQTGMLGAFLALDGFTFYIFWELMLIPMYFLIGVWGGGRRVYSALKFVIYTAFGSLLMLVAIVYLAYLHNIQFGSYSFFLGDWANLVFSREQSLWLFFAFFLAFAIKVPMFPFHTWLPDAHVDAPTGGSVILAGVLLKMGIYGLIRFALPVFPALMVEFSVVIGALGVIGIVYGALVAWVQTDMKKLVAYSSVSHMGYCVLGLAALNFNGVQGAIIQLLNHGVSTAALFFIVGVLYERKHTREIADYGGLAQKVPIFCFVFLVFTLSSIALPLTNGFIGEFLILLGGFQFNVALGAVAVGGVILGAVYMLSLYRRVVFGDFDSAKNGDLTDLSTREVLVFAPLLLLVFVIGLYPQPILARIEPASAVALSYVEGMRAKKLPYFGQPEQGSVQKAEISKDILMQEVEQSHNEVYDAI
jgi:NADH-quinone oxidoreductase subunit M